MAKEKDALVTYEAKWTGRPSLQLTILKYLWNSRDSGGRSITDVVANALISPDGLPTALVDEVRCV